MFNIVIVNNDIAQQDLYQSPYPKTIYIHTDIYSFAEREGFEPSVSLRPQHLSRVPLSTTQAPLQNIFKFLNIKN